MIRGDRSFNLATTPIEIYPAGLRMVNATTLRATGNLVYGTVTYSSTSVTGNANGATVSSTAAALSNTASGFSMVANPYACPVMWGTGTATNSGTTTVFGASTHINGSYWYLDPTLGGTGYYRAYNAISGSSSFTNSGGTASSGTAGSQYIQPGQAVFVQTSATSPTVVFQETAKAAGSTMVAVFGTTTPLSKIYVSLNKQDATTGSYNRVDGAALAFSDNFGNTVYGPQDALKFGNANDNLYITDKGKNLSIDGRLPATATDKLPIAISKVSGTSYQLVVDASNYTDNGFAPYLIDSYRGITTTLTSGVNIISFTADANIAASFANRFSLVFKPSTLAVNSIVASATLSNKIATISWNTVGEKGVSRFEVEKSTDAKSFAKIGQSAAKNTAMASYTITDNAATAAISYYRIKAISEVGTVSYSNVAKLTTNNSTLTTIYPNPLKGKTLNISLSNVAAGKYTVAITNVLGQKIQEATISHQGGSASHAITVSSALAAGTYNVSIRETASGQLVHQTSLIVDNL